MGKTRLACLAAVMLALPMSATAEEATASGLATVELMDVATQVPRTGVRRAARIDPTAIPAIAQAERLRLEVFGRVLLADRDSLQAHEGGWTWQGAIEGGGWAQFASYKGRLAGYLQADGMPALEIMPLADGGSAFVQLDAPDLPDPGQPLRPATTSPDEPGVASADEAHAGTTWVDALIAYTPAAEARVGGHAAVVARAYADVAWTNRAFANNGIDLRFRLVAVKRLGLTEPAGDDWEPFLRSFQQNATARTWRNQYGADLMGIYVHREQAPVCGLGYVMANVGAGFADWPYQLTWIDCTASTYAHESGHNMGLEHDPANGPAPTEASYPWSFGHGVSNGDQSFRTIMAYRSVCGGNPCTLAWGYSTPERYLYNLPLGIAGQRDNTRSIRSTMGVVSGFRPSQMLFQGGFE